MKYHEVFKQAMDKVTKKYAEEANLLCKSTMYVMLSA